MCEVGNRLLSRDAPASQNQEKTNIENIIWSVLALFQPIFNWAEPNSVIIDIFLGSASSCQFIRERLKDTRKYEHKKPGSYSRLLVCLAGFSENTLSLKHSLFHTFHSGGIKMM